MIEVGLVDGMNKGIGRESAFINFRIPETALLKYIDEYGGTVFNRLQMVDFLAEWNAAKIVIETEEQRIQWEKVRDLAVECRDSVHLTLPSAETNFNLYHQ